MSRLLSLHLFLLSAVLLSAAAPTPSSSCERMEVERMLDMMWRSNPILLAMREYLGVIFMPLPVDVEEFRPSSVKDEVKSWVGKQMYFLSSYSKEAKKKEQPFFFDPILNRWDNFLLGILPGYLEEHAEELEQQRLSYLDSAWVQERWDSIITDATRGPWMDLGRADELNLVVNRLVRDFEDFERDVLNSTQFTTRYGDMESIREYVDIFTEIGGWSRISDTLHCYYDYLETANSPFSRAITDKVSREVFNSHVDRLVSSTQLLLTSPDLASGLVHLGQALLDKARTVDYNDLWSTAYHLLLVARTDLVLMDVQTLYNQLLAADRAVQEGFWRLTTGRWPSMERAVRTVARNFYSDGFWDGLDEIYVDSVNEQFRSDREVMVAIQNQVLPALEDGLTRLEGLANDVEGGMEAVAVAVRDYDIRRISDTDLGIFGMVLETSPFQVISCYVSDFFGIFHYELAELRRLSDLVFSNVTVPEGLEDLPRKMSQEFWGVTLPAIVGGRGCPDPLVESMPAGAK